MNIILSEHFLKTKVGLPNLGTPNVILDIFIRTGVAYSFSHTAPLFPLNRTQTQAKNLLNNNVYFTILCPFFISDGRNGRVNLPHDRALQ